MDAEAEGVATGRTPRLTDQVVGEIERRIAAGELAPGLTLSELGLAETFGVSRAPVRTALRRLERNGLVRRADGRRGYVVAAPPARGSATAAAPVAATADAEPAPRKLTAAASWEGIYRDVSRRTVARAAFGRWRIIETELAAHYGVSRTVAREVLARLEHVGIIRKDAGSRWYLPALTDGRVGELYEMRRLLEPVALRQAAAHAPRALLVRMRADLEAVSDRPERALPRDLDRMEQDLHIELLSFADNATLVETLQHYHALLITNAVLYEATSGSFIADPFIAEHLAVVRALESGNPGAAAEHLEEHLRISGGRALRRIECLVRTGTLEPLRYLAPLPL
ncbi:GntR family transcriptional regulator [Azospirillum halopraeferens]|uniref:GntR family transcriptional regulator n=1 Tax=Azospirillum halopraeferens TaxID=34010 RepID=UPI000A0773D0|nr:GntR family transcriptional regulator [Azospirillum halopraeferens]